MKRTSLSTGSPGLIEEITYCFVESLPACFPVPDLLPFVVPIVSVPLPVLFPVPVIVLVSVPVVTLLPVPAPVPALVMVSAVVEAVESDVVLVLPELLQPNDASAIIPINKAFLMVFVF